MTPGHLSDQAFRGYGKMRRRAAAYRPTTNSAISQTIGTQKTSDKAIQSTAGRADGGTWRSGEFIHRSTLTTCGSAADHTACAARFFAAPTS